MYPVLNHCIIPLTRCVIGIYKKWTFGHFSCILCDDEFLLLVVLIRHLTIDHEDVFSCVVCEEGFLPPAVLIWHLSIDHLDIFLVLYVRKDFFHQLCYYGTWVLTMWTFFLSCMWGRISSTSCVITALEYWSCGRFLLCCMWGRISSTSCDNMALEYWPCGRFFLVLYVRKDFFHQLC